MTKPQHVAEALSDGINAAESYIIRALLLNDRPVGTNEDPVWANQSRWQERKITNNKSGETDPLYASYGRCRCGTVKTMNMSNFVRVRSCDCWSSERAKSLAKKRWTKRKWNIRTNQSWDSEKFKKEKLNKHFPSSASKISQKAITFLR